jgi:hypothetical protein
MVFKAMVRNIRNADRFGSQVHQDDQFSAILYVVPKVSHGIKIEKLLGSQ